MSLKEVYTYFLQARELLLKTYNDYPYGIEWTEDDKNKFEHALGSYMNYYMMVNDYLKEHADNLTWKSEEHKKEFLKGWKDVAESDMKIFNCLRIRHKWHKEFEANITSILTRLARSISSELFLQIPRGKGKFYTRALETLIKEIGKDEVNLDQLRKPYINKTYNVEWFFSKAPELKGPQFNDQDYNRVFKAYKYVRELAVRIFDGLTSTNEAKGFDGYGFKGKKYLPSFCSGGIDLNRQDWIRLKDAYEDIEDDLDYGIIRDKKLNFFESAEHPYSKNQLIYSAPCHYTAYKKCMNKLNESLDNNVKIKYDYDKNRILFLANRDIDTGEKLIF